MLELRVSQRKKDKRTFTINEIKNDVGFYFGFDADTMAGRSRKAKVVLARHIAMYLGRAHGHTFESIGGALDRDHTTVIHGVDRIQNESDLPQIKDHLKYFASLYE